jgi:hypothetical protein
MESMILQFVVGVQDPSRQWALWHQVLFFVGVLLVGVVCIILLARFSPVGVNRGQHIRIRNGTSNESEKLTPCSVDRSALAFSIEGLRAEPMGEGAWLISVYLGIFNSSNGPVTIFDVHANAYCGEAFRLPPMTLGLRYAIEILQNNSILAAGRVYCLEGAESIETEIVFEISRLQGGMELKNCGGFVLSIFGLDVDYSYHDSGRLIKMRVPVDAVFCFQDIGGPGHLVEVNQRNLDVYFKKHKWYSGGRQLVKACKKALGYHTAHAYLLS